MQLLKYVALLVAVPVAQAFALASPLPARARASASMHHIDGMPHGEPAVKGELATMYRARWANGEGRRLQDETETACLVDKAICGKVSFDSVEGGYSCVEDVLTGEWVCA